MPPSIRSEQIAAAHQYYCHLTSQGLGLGFDRERQWYEWLRAGFTLEDLRRVVTYLQREIRQGRRNVGALKLSNLLQPDRFEEDLQISRVCLKAPPPVPPTARAPTPSLSPQLQEQARRRALTLLRQLKGSLP